MKISSYIIKGIFSLSIMILLLVSITGQESDFKERRKTKLASEIKQYKDNFQIALTLSAKKIGEKGRDYFEGCKLSVQLTNDSSELVLGESYTNSKGLATIIIPKSSDYILDEEGFLVFEANFSGNDSLKAVESELLVREAYLEMEFFEKDSLKMIKFYAAENVSGEEEIPFEEIDIVLYSQGLFSMLKLGTAWMEGGEAMMPFPTDLPGDTLGNLLLIARIEDSDDHGVIETKGSIDWARHKEVAHALDRGLGDTEAPLWMVYTLIILLSAVWLHYFYIIFSFFMIRQVGNAAKKEMLQE